MLIITGRRDYVESSSDGGRHYVVADGTDRPLVRINRLLIFLCWDW